MKFFFTALLVFSLMAVSACATGPRPFDRSANAADLISNTVKSLDQQTKLLLTFGANWCSDSRALAAAYASEPLATLIAKRYEVLYVDVGRRDHNMALAERFNVPVMGGIPGIAIVNLTGEIEFSSQATDLYTAETMSAEEIYAYFEKL